MSHILLNRQQMNERFPDTTTLAVAIKYFESEFQKVSEVVCLIKINGMALTEADEIKYAEVKLSELDSLEISSRTPEDILGEIVSNWLVEIPKMIETNDKLAQELRFKGPEGHLKSLISLIDNCQLLVDSMISIQSLFQSFAAVQSKSWKESQQMAAAAISEGLTAFQAKDYNLMADVLEYDLGHSLQIWLELLQNISKEKKQISEQLKIGSENGEIDF